MLEMAGIRHGMCVLDVAAHAGDRSLDVAQRASQPDPSVLATARSPAILAPAPANSQRAGFEHVRPLVANAEWLRVEPQSLDAAVCRPGPMSCPDALADPRHMYRALRPGAAPCTVVFGRPERNPFITIPMSAAPRHAEARARDPFAPGALRGLGGPA
jgi:ubiquinone/menaquinone biosynthesis C-methylase UbiE